jgi:hypothetical protein
MSGLLKLQRVRNIAHVTNDPGLDGIPQQAQDLQTALQKYTPFHAILISALETKNKQLRRLLGQASGELGELGELGAVMKALLDDVVVLKGKFRAWRMVLR